MKPGEGAVKLREDSGVMVNGDFSDLGGFF